MPTLMQQRTQLQEAATGAPDKKDKKAASKDEKKQ
jgi:hypothetical protein